MLECTFLCSWVRQNMPSVIMCISKLNRRISRSCRQVSQLQVKEFQQFMFKATEWSIKQHNCECACGGWRLAGVTGWIKAAPTQVFIMNAAWPQIDNMSHHQGCSNQPACTWWWLCGCVCIFYCCFISLCFSHNSCGLWGGRWGNRDGGGQWDGKRLGSLTHTLLNACLQTHLWVDSVLSAPACRFLENPNSLGCMCARVCVCQVKAGRI